MNFIKQALQTFFKITPYQIKKRLPNITLDPVKLLMAYYLATGESKTIVQIGACDGKSCDPLYRFLRTGKIKALLIEPMPGSHAQLIKNYAGVPNVAIIQAAISRTDGTMTMYSIRPGSKRGERDEGMLLASFYKEHLIRYGVAEADILPTTVPSLSLQTLLTSQKIADIDLLQIDTEGYDAEIVRMALDLPVLPKAINFEKKQLDTTTMADVHDRLQQKGYLLVYDEMNTLAVLESVERALSNLGQVQAGG